MTVKPEKRCKNMENITVKSNAEYKFDRSKMLEILLGNEEEIRVERNSFQTGIA